MLKREYGKSGLSVSVLGLGAGHIGSHELGEREVERLLAAALGAGVTLIDTARSYGLAEERIGRYLGGRRQEVVLSTKCGYDIPGHENWTGPCITAGVEAALERLRTDYIDIMHLHSCPTEVLARGEVALALERAVVAGKVRVAAYSGEEEPLKWAVESARFGGIQTSVNVCDQRGIDGVVARAAAAGLGVIAKRPLANAPWLHGERPVGEYVEEYWLRWRSMKLAPEGLDWDDLALRFSAFAPGVTSAIVGSSRVEHLERDVSLVERGPLPEPVVSRIRHAFFTHDDHWGGQI